jgi:hypothetical protein
MFLADKLNKGGSLGGYQISRSLRFNRPDTAYLNRTPATAGNRSTWTFSTWVKRNTLNDIQTILSAGDPSSGNYLVALFFFDNNLDLAVYNSSGTVAYRITSTALYRDVSAWYHVIAVVDSTQATASNRLKLYVNGVQVTAFSTSSYPLQNDIFNVNATVPHFIGTYSYNTSANLISCNQTETYLVDGQALTPSSFGETNAQTGVWSPIAYSGSYGTNGFYLNFSDNSNTTAATLGKDYSGNGNNWTPNNFSVTAGAGNDSLVDSPTSYGTDTGVGGTVRGNYATLNPLSVLVGTTSNGNLDGDTGTTNGGVVYATMNIPNSGKWYWEYTQTNTGTSYSGIETVVSSTGASIPNTLRYIGDGTKEVNGTTTSYGASYGNTDIIGTAVDVDAGTVTFYKNGTSQGAITYATASINITPSWRDGSGSASLSYSANFGQRPFAYTAPSGFKALCTQNLPTPTIGATTATQAGKYFNTVLYTGTGSSLGVTGVGFQPDWVWAKGRSGATSHGIYDAVRGVQKQLMSNSQNAETTETTGITAFGSDGFTTGALAQLNTSAATYVAWNWKANGAGSSNTAGSITATVSANTTSGFSVVTWTSTGSAATIGHGLGVAPSMIITKTRNVTDDWYTYFVTLGNAQLIKLNSSAAAGATTAWNSTSPTSTVFSTSAGFASNGTTQVAYCFAEVAGYSKFGSYTGNGSTDGPFLFTGFRPAYVMIKCSSNAATTWIVGDGTRNPSNVADLALFPNLSNAEGSGALFDLTANGIKLRTTSSDLNSNGYTYIFMAFASAPLKYSLAR